MIDVEKVRQLVALTNGPPEILDEVLAARVGPPPERFRMTMTLTLAMRKGDNGLYRYLLALLGEEEDTEFATEAAHDLESVDVSVVARLIECWKAFARLRATGDEEMVARADKYITTTPESVLKTMMTGYLYAPRVWGERACQAAETLLEGLSANLPILPPAQLVRDDVASRLEGLEEDGVVELMRLICEPDGDAAWGLMDREINRLLEGDEDTTRSISFCVLGLFALREDLPAMERRVCWHRYQQWKEQG